MGFKRSRVRIAAPRPFLPTQLHSDVRPALAQACSPRGDCGELRSGDLSPVEPGVDALNGQLAAADWSTGSLHRRAFVRRITDHSGEPSYRSPFRGSTKDPRPED